MPRRKGWDDGGDHATRNEVQTVESRLSRVERRLDSLIFLMLATLLTGIGNMAGVDAESVRQAATAALGIP